MFADMREDESLIDKFFTDKLAFAEKSVVGKSREELLEGSCVVEIAVATEGPIEEAPSDSMPVDGPKELGNIDIPEKEVRFSEELVTFRDGRIITDPLLSKFSARLAPNSTKTCSE
jgi:hypothetical protein